MTGFLKWSYDYCTGIDDIDLQHQRLFDVTSELVEKLQTVADTRSLLQAYLKKLGDYVDYHFETEEVLMKSHGYPGMEEHRIAHHELRERFTAMRTRFEQGSDVKDEAIAFISHWFKDHILGADMHMGRYLYSKGGA